MILPVAKPRVLVVGNHVEMSQLLARHLRDEGFDVEAVGSGAEGFARLEAEPFAVVLTDLMLDGGSGLDVLHHVQRWRPGARVVLLAAPSRREHALEALREGASGYLIKPVTMAEVTVAVRRALEHHRLGPGDGHPGEPDETGRGFEALVGSSAALRNVICQLREVARTDATLLLLGESGTGKELLARAVHGSSVRRRGPFVPVNCAAIPESLLESELFGHEKGAFTGATLARPGLFTEAEGGTLFLDEIGDMPPAIQAKLLRALQDTSFRPVGGRREVHVDVRLISATNRDLAILMRERRFRPDLYYRLAVIPVVVPSLRERVEDIPTLAAHFARRAAAVLGKPFRGFSDEAMAWLCGHRWPGNVRELENMIQRATTRTTGCIELADLGTGFAVDAPDTGVCPTLAEVEDEYIRRVLRRTRGDKRAAARILGISVRTLQRRTPSVRTALPDAS